MMERHFRMDYYCARYSLVSYCCSLFETAQTRIPEAFGCLFFAGFETVQKVAETQSAQITEADEEPLGGNFLFNFVNPIQRSVRKLLVACKLIKPRKPNYSGKSLTPMSSP